MGRVPDDLIFPILNRFDQSRVHHSVAWDKRFNTVVGQHIHFWRPRVVITFETVSFSSKSVTRQSYTRFSMTNTGRHRVLDDKLLAKYKDCIEFVL